MVLRKAAVSISGFHFFSPLVVNVLHSSLSLGVFNVLGGADGCGGAEEVGIL